MKRCTNRHCIKAGELQSFASFNKNITTRSGYSCRCKVCLGNAAKLSARQHAWLDQNKGGEIDRLFYKLRAVIRTLNRRIEQGLIKIG